MKHLIPFVTNPQTATPAATPAAVAFAAVIAAHAAELDRRGNITERERTSLEAYYEVLASSNIESKQ